VHELIIRTGNDNFGLRNEATACRPGDQSRPARACLSTTSAALTAPYLTAGTSDRRAVHTDRCWRRISAVPWLRRRLVCRLLSEKLLATVK
jgi:hypothetical protein